MKNTTLITACALVALAGMPAGAQVIDWAAPIDGNWNNASNWLGGNIPNAIGEDAILAHASAYTVDMTSTFSIGSLSLTNPAATLAMGQSLTLTLSGDLFNDGFIFVNEPGSVFDAFLRFNAPDAIISGSGSIRLGAIGNPADAQLIANGGVVLTNTSGHTIHGSGHLSGTIMNDGFIIADDAVGPGLRIASTVIQGPSGSISANTGTILLGGGSLTSGGTMSTINGGQILVENGTPTIGNITNAGLINVPGQSYTLAMNGDVTNTGVITLNSNSSTFNAHLRFNTNSTLGGSGTVTMIAIASNDAQIITGGAFVGTIGADQLVKGSGEINGASGGTINNLGTINGDDATALSLFGTHTGDGMYRSDDGLLNLANGLNLNGGTFDSSGTGIVDMTGGGVVTLLNVTNLGQMGVRGQGSTVALAGPMTNDGTFTINSNLNGFNAHIRFDANTMIDGNGLIRMQIVGDLGDAQILTGSPVNGTIGASQTIAGSGLVDGRSGGTIINNGTINGDHAIDGKTPAKALELRGNINGSGGGIFRSDDGILALGNGLMLDGGTFDSSGVGIVDMTVGGIATLANVTNLGHMGIRGQSSTVSLIGPLTNDGTFTVNSNNNGFNAHIRFDADTIIDGSGEVRMVSVGELGDAQLFTNGLSNGTIGANQTIAGSGIIDGRSGGTIVNNGTINGDDLAFSLELRGNHSGGGMYRSDDGILSLGNGLMLDGGTFDSSGTGIVDMVVGGLATLSNVTNIGLMGIRGQGSTVALIGPMTNEGTFTVNSNNNGFNAHIRFDADTSIDGSGTVRLQSVGDLGDAQVFTNSQFLGTIGINQTVAGSGLVDGRSGGTIINNGTINGDDPVFALELRGNHDGAGGGVYRSDGDGVLGLANGLVMNGGTFDSSGNGIVDMTASGVAMLANITNEGTLGIRGQGGVIGLFGPLTNNGTILINSNDNGFNAHIRFFDAVEINGTGTINMELAGSFGDAQFLNDQGFVGTIASGQTITGSGMIVGEMNMGGTFDPSSDERRFDVDSLNFSATSAIVADLGGLLAGEYDRLTVGNGSTVNLDGTLTVNLDPGYVPVFGDTWDIIDGGTINGLFADENLPPAGLGQIYRVIYEPSQVYVILTCDADLSGDGVINFFDVAAFLGFFGAGDVRGDLTGDGNFNFFDVSLFLQLFGSGCEG